MKLSMAKIQITADQIGWFAMIPSTELDQERFQKIPLGEVLSVEARRQRNPRHHRLYWSVMHFVWQNHNPNHLGFRFYSKEQVSQYLLIRTLHIRAWMNFPDGSRVPVTESISWIDMDQDEFQEYWNECEPIIEELMDMPMDKIISGLGGMR